MCRGSMHVIERAGGRIVQISGTGCGVLRVQDDERGWILVRAGRRDSVTGVGVEDGLVEVEVELEDERDWSEDLRRERVRSFGRHRVLHLRQGQEGRGAGERRSGEGSSRRRYAYDEQLDGGRDEEYETGEGRSDSSGGFDGGGKRLG